METYAGNNSGRRGGKWILVFAVALVMALGIGLGLRQIAFAQQTQAPLPSPQDLSRTFISVAKQIKPAVVNIDVVEKSKRSSMRVPEGLQIPGLPNFGDMTPRKQK